MRAWELDATPSVCNGCATGCNIEIHHKNGRAWRLVPRHNPDVNAYWMCDEGRFTYHDLREQRLAGALVDGLPAGWDRAIAAAADRLTTALRDPSSVGVVLSAVYSNEDNFALASLAKAWGVTNVFVAGKPPVPARADGRLRVADVNPNTAGVEAIASALGVATRPASDSAAQLAGLRVVVMLGDVLPGVDAGRLRELDLIALSAHERGPVTGAKVAFPVADWAEIAGTITNDKGHVQRMHAAFQAPGQALPAWEAITQLAVATKAKLARWTHAREVFKDMTAAVPAWKSLTWVREARPLALRFAGSRG
jgi:NADH-quinone oxidoreductase subunit G